MHADDGTPDPRRHHPRAALCGHCGARTAVGADATCAYCGGGLRLLEPLAVECGWCAMSNRRDLTADCARCGGALPALPGGAPGPRPPDVPRQLPHGYESRVTIWKNVYTLIGVVFTVVFCWTILFPLIGLPFWVHGVRSARRKLAALRLGQPTGARITAIALDRSQQINQRHPWRIEYVFQTENGSGTGACQSWDASTERRRVGDALWVVHVPEQPGVSAIWPPIH